MEKLSGSNSDATIILLFYICKIETWHCLDVTCIIELQLFEISFQVQVKKIMIHIWATRLHQGFRLRLVL